MLLAQYRRQFLLLNFQSDFLSRSSNLFRRSSTYSHFNKGTISQSLVGFPSCLSSIEVLDTDTWIISSSLSHTWGGRTLISPSDPKPPPVEIEADNSSSNSPDFDEIEDMRIRGNLFYKMLKNSKEYEEHCVRFSGINASNTKRKPSSNKKQGKNKIKGRSSKNVNEIAKSRKNEDLIHEGDLCLSEKDGSDRTLRKTNESVDGDKCSVEKKARVPSFNKLAAPYLFPFCLDIFTSKKSVRACVVHRVTNKVVVVAHSISKDLKMDLGSGRGLTICATVGEVLARRALADDIYSVVYTPRKGEIIKGKIQDVLQSIIANGVCVNIKLKQKNESVNTLIY